MNLQRLFLLLSLSTGDDFKFYESWDDDWDWLYSHDYIDLENDDDPPTLTDKGKRMAEEAVKAADVHD